MQAGTRGGTGGSCTITHKINPKVMPKMPLQAYFLIKPFSFFAG